MLTFVPRKVAQKSAKHASTVPLPPPSPSLPAPTPGRHTSPKGKEKASEIKDEDLAILVWLSLSDYSLWSNVDLRRTVDIAEDGWIPISHILQHSLYIHPLSSKPPETAFVKAIRAHAQDFFEVRMLVSSPSKGAWYGDNSSSQDALGGYEIRRKDWFDTLAFVRNSTRNEWEARSVYIEHIPLHSRTIPAIYRFVSSILDSATTAFARRIQHIVLPPHVLDRPGDVPKCKGFAIVTFADTIDANKIVTDWPWLPRRTTVPEDGPAVPQEAVKFGFRALTKERWENLKEEYLAYRQMLLDEIPTTEGDHAGIKQPNGYHHATTKAEEPEQVQVIDSHAHRAQPSLDPFAPFPPGCLVFVRNVHPETNKTTLKALFACHAFGSTTSIAIDYVDYNKGMTSCHLRLSTPRHAQVLVSALQSDMLVQRQGLDSTGSPPAKADQAKPLSAEVVDGEREVLYWNKVPEKVRCEAVQKAIAQLASVNDREPGSGGQDAVDDVTEQHGKRPRKRKRKA